MIDSSHQAQKVKNKQTYMWLIFMIYK